MSQQQGLLTSAFVVLLTVRSNPMFSFSVEMQTGKSSFTDEHLIQHLLVFNTVNETLYMASSLKESQPS